MSKTYVVELRDNDFNTSDDDEVVGYLGWLSRGEDHEVLGVVTHRSAAAEYTSPTQPNYDMRNLSDEFFDRYFTAVVGEEGVPA